jgi:hypothetical protein
MARGMLAVLCLLSVVSVLHVLRLSVNQVSECHEIKGWVYDEDSGRCLVRLKRASSSMEVIVSGKSIDELETRAQCVMRGWVGAIETGCWKRRGGVIAQWIERGF